MRWTRSLISKSLLEQVDSDQEAIERNMHELAIDDGKPVQVLDVGEGDPILLLPMIAELNFVYAPQIEEFATDHRVVLYKPRLSPRSHVGIASRAKEAVSLMNKLGLKSV